MPTLYRPLPTARRTNMYYKLINNDCFMWMIEREENSITAIITDPPYGVKEYTEDEIVIG